MFRFFSSLKLAVIVILLLTASLVAGTLLESAYDIATARYWVYRANWFFGVLGLLGVNIICSAFSRWPWQKRHLPFLFAHLGIILLLFGSWVTQRWGLDGSLRVSEGGSSSLVEIDSYQLTLEHAGRLVSLDFPWQPPGLSFSPIEYKEYGFKIDQFLSHADPLISFEPTSEKGAGALAAQLKLLGGPMNLKQDLWLWQGDPSWSQMTLGPLKVLLIPKGGEIGMGARDANQALLEIQPMGGDRVKYRAVSVRGEEKRGKIQKGKRIQTGWMGLQVALEQLIPNAINSTQFVKSKIDYGQDAPPPAIHVAALNRPGSGMWMGLGDRVELSYGTQVLAISFSQRRVMLPFGIQLDRFHLEHYEGTMNPSSFRSDVRVAEAKAGEPTTISMNEPLKHQGFTFYQASYEPAEPRPTTSIFSVNKDPGRELKYAGSFFLVLGTLMLFGRRYMTKRKNMVGNKIETVVLFFTLLLGATAEKTYAAPPVPASGWNWNTAALIPIQSGGRIKPLDSFARESVLYVTSSKTFEGWKPLEMVFSWMADPQPWADTAFIKIQNEEVKKQLLLDLGRKRFSPNELVQNKVLIQYAEDLSRKDAKTKLDPREQELKKILDRIGLFRTIISGEAMTVIPVQASGATPWSALAVASPQAKVVRAVFAEMLSAYQKKDLEYFQKLSAMAKTAIEKDISNWGSSSPRLLEVEYLYQKTQPFFWAMILYLLAALVWLLSSNFKEKKGKPWVIAAWSLTIGSFLVHAYGFALRCWVAGRPPVSNMYESVIWVSFGVLIFGFILYFIQKQRLIPGVASAVAGMMLFAADAAPAILDPNLHPLVPVLRSNYWLTIHVLTITLGYAGFALSLGIANVTLFGFIRKWNSSRIDHLNLMTYRAMQFGVVFLAAGTILGGIWADYSWGRFWGWDPKEVWALIALLTYIAILHGRQAGWVKNFGFAAWTVVSFLSVIMAWYGVNFVLGVGLHSYGFSTGGGTGVALFCIAQIAWVVWVAVTLRVAGRLRPRRS